MYALDINILINWLLPAAVRKVAMLHFLNALLVGVRKLNETFVMFTAKTRYDLRVTGQVRSLEFHLNRIFDPIPQAINITASVSGSQLFIFLESENQPLHLPVFISGASSDFTVHLPNNLPPQEAAIRAFLDKHKLPTKRYELVYDIFVM
jgi:hypothetical protein